MSKPILKTNFTCSFCRKEKNCLALFGLNEVICDDCLKKRNDIKNFFSPNSSKIGEDEKYMIYVGGKNPSCYPCCWEGSAYSCRSDLCQKWSKIYKLDHKFKEGEGIYLRDKNEYFRF